MLQSLSYWNGSGKEGILVNVTGLFAGNKSRDRNKSGDMREKSGDDEARLGTSSVGDRQARLGTDGVITTPNWNLMRALTQVVPSLLQCHIIRPPYTPFVVPPRIISLPSAR